MTTLLPLTIAVVLVCGLTLGAEAQNLVGTIAGQVTDAQERALPGVTVVLTGRTGSQEQVSDEAGNFRFIGLNPGEYAVRAELAGFQPFEERNIVVAIGATVQVRAMLQVGGVQEIVVVAAVSGIDAVSTATDTTICAGPAVRDADLAHQRGGEHAQQLAGHQQRIGVRRRRRVGQRAAARRRRHARPRRRHRLDVLQLQHHRQGRRSAASASRPSTAASPAPWSTRSPSRAATAFSGLFEHRYTARTCAATTSATTVKARESDAAGAAASTSSRTTPCSSAVRSRDKAFFFGSIQRYSIKEDPAGPRTIRTEVSPRFNGKLTFQPTPSDTIIGERSSTTSTTRPAGAGFLARRRRTTDELTVEQDSPECIWNGSYRKVLGDSSFFEAKFTGYWGYFDLDPMTPMPARLDDDGSLVRRRRLQREVRPDAQSGQRLVLPVRRGRGHAQLQVRRRDRAQHDPQPLCLQRRRLLLRLRRRTVLRLRVRLRRRGQEQADTFYAQDQWKIGRVTANVGLRFDGIRGDGDDGNEVLQRQHVGPRLGLAWDVTGRATSVLRRTTASSTTAPCSRSWNRAVPGDRRLRHLRGPARQQPGRDRPRLGRQQVRGRRRHQSPAHRGVQRLLRAAAVGQLAGDGHLHPSHGEQLHNSTLIGGTWTPTAFTNPMNNQPMTIYSWGNRASTPQRFDIDNLGT